MTRQRKYQLRQKRKGRCIYCAARAVMGNVCLQHAVQIRERNRRRRKSHREYRCQSRELEQSLSPSQKFLALDKSIVSLL